MEGKAKELAEFIRTIGLNSKFLDDRRKEVQVYSSTSQPGMLGSLPLGGKCQYGHEDIKQFLNSRCISWNDQDFEAILEQINPNGVLEIETYELGFFFGMSQSIGQSGTQKDEMLDAQLVRLFEQVISCHRKTEPLREKLKAVGQVIDLYRLLDDKGFGIVSASKLIEFLLKHGSIDTQILYHLLREIEKKGGLTFQLLNWWLEPVGLRRLCIGQFNHPTSKPEDFKVKDDHVKQAEKDYSYIEDLKSSGSGFWQARHPHKTSRQHSKVSVQQANIEKGSPNRPRERSTFSRQFSQYQVKPTTNENIPLIRLPTKTVLYTQHRPFTPTSTVPPIVLQPLNKSLPMTDRCWNLEQQLGKTEQQIHKLRSLLESSHLETGFKLNKTVRSLSKPQESVVVVNKPIQIVGPSTIRQFRFQSKPLVLGDFNQGSTLIRTGPPIR